MYCACRSLMSATTARPSQPDSIYTYVLYLESISITLCIHLWRATGLSSVCQWRDSYCTDFSEANSDLLLPTAFDIVFAAVILSDALWCSCPYLYLTFITELFSSWKPLQFYICKMQSSQLFSHIQVLSCSLSGLLSFIIRPYDFLSPSKISISFSDLFYPINYSERF